MSATAGATRAPSREDGFAATDALVALLILSTTLALALVGVTTARHLSEVARQTTQAAHLAESLIARGEGGGGNTAGRVKGFIWRIDADPIANRTDLCSWRLVLQSTSDHRTYRFASAGACG